MKETRTSNLVHSLTLLFFVGNIFLFIAIQTSGDHFNLANIRKSVETSGGQLEIESLNEESLETHLILQWKLVNSYVDGDWRVEKYQEYEVYVDGNGKQLREVPTVHYNYLQYWRY